MDGPREVVGQGGRTDLPDAPREVASAPGVLDLTNQPAILALDGFCKSRTSASSCRQTEPGASGIDGASCLGLRNAKRGAAGGTVRVVANLAFRDATFGCRSVVTRVSDTVAQRRSRQLIGREERREIPLSLFAGISPMVNRPGYPVFYEIAFRARR